MQVATGGHGLKAAADIVIKCAHLCKGWTWGCHGRAGRQRDRRQTKGLKHAPRAVFSCWHRHPAAARDPHSSPRHQANRHAQRPCTPAASPHVPSTPHLPTPPPHTSTLSIWAGERLTTKETSSAATATDSRDVRMALMGRLRDRRGPPPPSTAVAVTYCRVGRESREGVGTGIVAIGWWMRFGIRFGVGVSGVIRGKQEHCPSSATLCPIDWPHPPGHRTQVYQCCRRTAQ